LNDCTKFHAASGCCIFQNKTRNFCLPSKQNTSAHSKHSNHCDILFVIIIHFVLFIPLLL
jgi:hypothetical protein